MKKLIRLFLAAFCLFFALQAMPGSFLPALRSLLQRAAQAGTDATLLIAEGIDALADGMEDGTASDPGQNAGGPGEKAGGEDESGKIGDGESGNVEDGSSEDGSDIVKNAEDENDKDENGEGGNSGGGTGKSGNSKDENSEGGNGKSGDGENEGSEDAAGKGKGGADADSAVTGGAAFGGAEGGTPAQGDGTGGSAPGEAADEADIFYYYYTQISREERLLYDAMLALAQVPQEEDDPEEERLLSLNPSGEAFAESYTRAYNALVSDHPELFWIAQGRARYECRYYVLPSFGGNYKVVLSLDTTPGGVPLSAYGEEERELDEAAQELLAQVDRTRSEAEIALRIHDLLIDSAWYNTGAGADDYAHTAYGALVQDSQGNPGGALCDGYALAYEYLLQRAGLTCTMVCGYAGASEEDNEKHAWNLVMLDGDWYEVDATWDDLDFLLSPSDDGYDLLLEALSDEEYMQRIRHYMFNLTTDEIRSFTPGDEFRYTSYRGWVTLLQPSVHIRFTSEESGETRDYVTPLAPTAEGTWYTWDMLTGNE